MIRSHRREFLADVGRGMLVASVGAGIAQDLGLASAALAGEGPERLTFGPMEPLVALMQETPVNRLLPAVVERMKAGTDLRQLVVGRRPGQRPQLRRPGLRRAITRSWHLCRPTIWRANCPRRSVLFRS